MDFFFLQEFLWEKCSCLKLKQRPSCLRDCDSSPMKREKGSEGDRLAKLEAGLLPRREKQPGVTHTSKCFLVQTHEDRFCF